MRHVFSNQNSPPKLDVFLLPMIDLYVTTCNTFDLPIWYKAVGIIKAKKMNVVCWLGGFHSLMSFLGSIGSLMAGSGMGEMLEVCIYKYTGRSERHFVNKNSNKQVVDSVSGLYQDCENVYTS